MAEERHYRTTFEQITELIESVTDQTKLDPENAHRNILRFISLTGSVGTEGFGSANLKQASRFFRVVLATVECSVEHIAYRTLWNENEIKAFLESGEVSTRNPYRTSDSISDLSRPLEPANLKWALSPTGKLYELMQPILEQSSRALSEQRREHQKEWSDSLAQNSLVKNPAKEGSETYTIVVGTLEHFIKELRFSNELSDVEQIDDVRKKHLIDLLNTLIKSLEAPLLPTVLVVKADSEIDKFLEDAGQELRSKSIKEMANAASAAIKLLGKVVWECIKSNGG